MYNFVNIARTTLLLCLLTFHLEAQFVESSKALGIDHISINPNLIGGGVVSFDYNNDGWQDLYFTSGINKDVLYKNINGGKFESVDLPALSFTSRFNTSGAISGDFNNDGCQDLLVTTLSIDPNLLFINNCDDSFTLEYLHIRDSVGDYVSTAGAFATDFNDDGQLDIYLLNYVKEHHFLEDATGSIIGYDHDCFANSVLINQGEFKFEHDSAIDLAGTMGCSLAGSSSRFLGKGNNGAYIVNDFGEWIYPNELVDVNSQESIIGLEESMYGMGVAISDFDNDEDYDLYLTNIGKNKFLINEDNQFSNKAASYGIENELINDSTSVVSWGTMFLDFDNDSKQDLFVSNGYVPVADFLSSSIVNQNKLYRNDITEFTDITEVAGLASNGIHRGCIFTDINNDGLLDIVTSVISDSDLGINDIKRSKVFINKFRSSSNYLQIYLEGNDSNRNGYNAEVKLYIDSVVYSQILFSGTSYASQSMSSLHFGLGDKDMIDSLAVLWPQGTTSKFYNIEVNQQILIRENEDRQLVLGCTDVGAENYIMGAEINFGCIIKSTPTKELVHGDLSIFPNPTSDYITIKINGISELKPEAILIYNTSGQRVLIKTLDNHSDLEKIDISNLNSGCYQVQILTTDRFSITKTINVLR